jgi:hypothetical protein
MKPKEGRDFIALNDCVVRKTEEGFIIGDIASSFKISQEDMKKIVKFVTVESYRVQGIGRRSGGMIWL